MALTSKERDQILIAIAAKICPEVLEAVKRSDVGVKSLSSKKPFIDAIGYEEGLDKIENSNGNLAIMQFAKMVEVKSSELSKVAYSLNIQVNNNVRIGLEDARIIWRTYCAKRKW